jgi:hypothetical protein
MGQIGNGSTSIKGVLAPTLVDRGAAFISSTANNVAVGA